MKILIIEDTPESMWLLVQIIKRHGEYDILVSENGEKGVECAKLNVPDLIFMDVMLPIMDGYKACREIRLHKETEKIPIIFLTAKTQTKDIIKGFEVGGTDYIKKPVEPVELIARMDQQIKALEERDYITKNLSHKKKMLDILAHDLRSPLSAIMQLSELLDDLVINDEGKDILSESKEITENMNTILNDLITADELQSKSIAVETDLWDLHEIILSAITINENKALKKNISIHYSGKPLHALVDPPKTLQVLDNLISNSIKYSHPNKNISISLDTLESHARIVIKDEGLGFSEQDLKKIFNPFQKLSSSPTGNEKTTGLGLFIVKRLAEVQEASIQIESLGKGQGSTVTLLFKKS